MRVVYLSPAAGLGGAERCLLSVMQAARQALPDATLHLVAAADGPLLREAERIGIHATALPMPGGLAGLGDSAVRGRAVRLVGLACRALAAVPGLVRYARRLRRALREAGPDLIHSNGNKAHLLARLAAPAGVPVVWHLHDFLSRRSVMAPLLRWAARRAAGAIAVSEAVRRDARAALGALPVTMIHNVVDTGHFRPGPGDGPLLDRLAGLAPAAPGTVRVGLVATYARWKGQGVFLEAAARLRRSGAGPVRFYLIGGPVYATRGSQFSEEELRANAAALGLSGAVGFIGFRADVAELYRALDVVVHASTEPEPFGLTIAEAMACGRPVVVARAGGAAELFTDGQDAVGLPPNDPAALASAIAGLVDDPGRRALIAESARRSAVERFSCARLPRQVAEEYHHLLREARRPKQAVQVS